MDDSTPAPSLLAAVRILARGGDLVSRLAALAAEAGAVASARSSLVLLHDPEAAVITRPDSTPVPLDGTAADLVANVVDSRLPAWDVALGDDLAGELGGVSQGSVVPLVAADEIGPTVHGLLLLAGGDASAEATREAVLALGDLAAVAILQERLRAALDEHAAYQDRLSRTDPSRASPIDSPSSRCWNWSWHASPGKARHWRSSCSRSMTWPASPPRTGRRSRTTSCVPWPPRLRTRCVSWTPWRASGRTSSVSSPPATRRAPWRGASVMPLRTWRPSAPCQRDPGGRCPSSAGRHHRRRTPGCRGGRDRPRTVGTGGQRHRDARNRLIRPRAPRR